MFAHIIHKVPLLLVPAVILIATWFLIPHIPDLPPEQQDLVLFTPYIVSAMGLLLSVHFHRGRPFIILLMLVCFYGDKTRNGILRTLSHFVRCNHLVPSFHTFTFDYCQH
ncbi:MAG: hypothetical protein ACOYL3_23505, partial [Desulfuromonadaceae bacterium]